MEKKYQIIYADPPYQYNDKMGGDFMAAEPHYSTMPTKDICALRVKNISDENCALFLWAVSPMLTDALQVLKAWGFEYKTVAFVWSKITSEGAWVHNLGRWTIGNVEFCLLGIKGKPKRIKENIKQLIVAIRTAHSKKPDVARVRIVELMGNLPRIELFARGEKQADLFGYNRFDGWDCWGNEVESDIEL